MEGFLLMTDLVDPRFSRHFMAKAVQYTEIQF